jgi:hypothetical protein
MTNIAPRHWRTFWLLYAIAWALFAWMAIKNGEIAKAAAPYSIVSHQVAGDAATVNAIQLRWQQAGQYPLAKLSMWVDLVFIAFATLSGMLGGRLIKQRAGKQALKILATIVMAIWVVAGVTDYAETIPQVIQVSTQSGSDTLAGLAAAMQSIKILAYLGGTLLLWIGLAWLAFDRRNRPGT